MADFFIHIATIVLGLLIAVGLEQTVELIHCHRQAHEMEDALRDESIENRTVIQHDLAAVAEYRRIVRLNMEALDRTRVSGGKEAFVPVAFGPDAFFAPTDTAWLTLRDNGLLSIPCCCFITKATRRRLRGRRFLSILRPIRR